MSIPTPSFAAQWDPQRLQGPRPVRSSRAGSVGTVVIYLCMLVLIANIGCGPSSPPSPPVSETTPARAEDSANPAPQSAPVDRVAANRMKQEIVGTWLGEASLDTAQLQQTLETLPVEQRESILNLADEFLTTVMAVDFRADGTLEQEIEITPRAGGPIRDGGTGNWRILKASAGQVDIETTTQLIDGTVVTDQQQYLIASGGNPITHQIAKRVDLGDAFSQCNPMIVLRRQQLPDTLVAEQINEPTTSR